MTSPPRVLAIGGIDPTGGAGLAADVRMIHARGGVALTVATCQTVQNRDGFRGFEEVGPDGIRGALRAALEDGPIHAVKVGLTTPGSLEPVCGFVKSELHGKVPIVVDPVLVFTAGGSDLGLLVPLIRDHLVPLASVVTPNADELRMLAGDGGAAELLGLGAAAVLAKGGHGKDDPVRDVLHTAAGEKLFEHPRLQVGPVRGTGCALASALAVHLGSGAALEEACGQAVEELARCLEATQRSKGRKPVPLRIA